MADTFQFLSVQAINELNSLLTGNKALVILPSDDDNTNQGGTQKLGVVTLDVYKTWLTADVNTRIDNLESGTGSGYFPAPITLTMGGPVTGAVTFDGTANVSWSSSIANGALSLAMVDGLTNALTDLEDGTSIAEGSLELTQLAPIPATTLLGNPAATTADVVSLSVPSVRNLLGIDQVENTALSTYTGFDTRYWRSDAAALSPTAGATVPSSFWSDPARVALASIASASGYPSAGGAGWSFVGGTGASLATFARSFDLFLDAQTTNSAYLWLRNYDTSGTPNAWVRLLTSADTGAGHGLDADLLDGQEGAYYTNLGNATGTLSIGLGGTGATSLTGLVKGNGTSPFTAAVPGTDYVIPSGNISGSAGSASKLTSAVTIALSGGVTGSPTSFDGSSSISINVTAVALSAATGTLSVTHGGTGITSYTAGNYLYASGTTTLAQRTPAQVLSDIGALSAASYTAGDVLIKLKTVDGAGSGLDADLLDGQEGSYYLDFGNASNLPTTLAGYGITDAITQAAADGAFLHTPGAVLNANASTGTTYWTQNFNSIATSINGSGSTNYPATYGVTWSFILNTGAIASNFERAFDLHKSASADSLYFRTFNTSTGLPIGWHEFYHSGNFTPGNYLPLTGGTVTGPVTFSDSVTLGADMLPDVDNTRSLGSPTLMWKDVYVGPGSLYINGQQVLSNQDAQIIISADVNQDIAVKTQGAGSILLQPVGNGTIQFRSTVQFQAGAKVLSSDGNSIDYGDSITFDTGKGITGGLTIDGNTAWHAGNLDPTTFATLNSLPSLTQVTLSRDPQAPMEAATKQYVDAVAQGISIKHAVACATTANITLSGLQTIDGYTTVAGDRVLVMSESATATNGIYVAATGAWTRSTDADTWSELVSAFTFVENGSKYAWTGWVCSIEDGGTLGTTAITWTQFAGGGAITQGTGIIISGNEVSLAPSGVTGGTYTKLTVDAYGRATAGASLTASDIPSLSTSILTSGTLSVARGGTGVVTLTGLVKGNGTAAFSAAVAGTDYVIPSGSITGNAATATKLATARTINGVSFDGSSNITITSVAPYALTIGNGLVGGSYTGSAAVTVSLATPSSIGNGSTNSVTASTHTHALSLVASDIPNLSTAILTSGTLPVARGGTGATTLTGLVKGSGTSAFVAATAGLDYVIPSGSITGNAGSAAKWSTARTFTLSGDVTGSASVDGSANVTLNATFANLKIETTTAGGFSSYDGITTAGFYSDQSLTGHPGAPFGQLMVAYGGGTSVGQLYFDCQTSDHVWIRQGNPLDSSGTWGDWTRLLTLIDLDPTTGIGAGGDDWDIGVQRQMVPSAQGTYSMPWDEASAISKYEFFNHADVVRPGSSSNQPTGIHLPVQTLRPTADQTFNIHHQLAFDGEGTQSLFMRYSLSGQPRFVDLTNWQANTTLAVGAWVKPTSPTGFLYEVSTAGVTGTTEPSWPTASNTTVTDGSVVWTTHWAWSDWHQLPDAVHDITITGNWTFSGAASFTGTTSFTQPITLPSDPTSALQAVTKQYVDNHFVSSVTTHLGIVGTTNYDNSTNTAAAWSALPVGYSRMMGNYASIGTAGGAPTDSYGYFTKIANHDNNTGGWGGLWIDCTTNGLYVGTATSGTSFATWTEQWSSANDGAGSGLDADLLDGQQGSYYAPASSVVTLTGNTEVISGSKYVFAPITYAAGQTVAGSGFWTDNASIAGIDSVNLAYALVLKTNLLTASYRSMFRITVEGYDYSKGAFTYVISGYFYPVSNTIPNFFYTLDGVSPAGNAVRGVITDDGYFALVLGADTTAWNYPKIRVHLMVGYGGTTISEGITAQFVADTTAYTTIAPQAVLRQPASFTQLTDLPTTLGGYGITDGLTQTAADALYVNQSSGINSADGTVSSTFFNTQGISGTANSSGSTGFPQPYGQTWSFNAGGGNSISGWYRTFDFWKGNDSAYALWWRGYDKNAGTPLAWNQIWDSSTFDPTTYNAPTATKLATATSINGVSFDGTTGIVVTANTPFSISAGSGLTGSSFNGSANVAFALGTPSTVGNGSTNALTATSHTHAISLAVSDIPSLSTAILTSGTLGVARGGTGATTLTGLIKGNGTSAFTVATAGTDYVVPSGSITGNAATATKLATARTINGVSFDGSANITITAAAPYALSTGNGLAAGSYNGSAAVAFSLGVPSTLGNGSTNAVTSTSHTHALNLVASDIPNLPASIITSGIIPVVQGGTGVATLSGLLKGAGTSAVVAATAGVDFVLPSGSITGNAGSATKLATARTIGLTGLTATAASFDGSANVTIGVTAVPTGLLSGTIGAGNMPAYTGDVTSPAGSVASTIAAGAVTLAKMAPLAASSLIGNGTTSSATPTAITLSPELGFNSATVIGIQAASLTNAMLANSTITIGTTSIGLGASSLTLVGLTGVTATTFTGALQGNATTASSATTLTTARTIGTTGITSTPASFNGSANVTIAVTAVPASLITGTLPVANGGTGATSLTGLLKGNGTGAFTAAVPGTDYLPMSGGSLTGPLLLAANPTTNLGAATKQYVDSAIQSSTAGLFIKSPAVVVALSNITLSGLQTIDGVSLTAGQRVLVIGQTNGANNGIYVVASGAWSLASDSVNGELVTGTLIFVSQGTAYAGTQWYLQTTGTITVGTTVQVWVQFAASHVYTNGNGIALIGNAFSVTPTPSGGLTVSASGVAVDATLVAFKASATIGDGSSLTYVVTHNLGTLDVMVSVRNLSTGDVVIAGVNAATINTVTITFNTPPATNSRRVTVIG